MMDELRLDARRWRFLDAPGRYVARKTGGLELAPLTRQFRTAKEILMRLASGRGVLLADDVGLGKTTVGALVAWVVACQDMRVRIYAPNEVLRRRWAEELERHVPMLGRLGASSDRIRQGDVGRLTAGRIQIATHHALVKSHGQGEQRTACDLMIIDEAHRAKGEGSAFNEALRGLGDRAKRKLILTATPFSIRLTELEQLLQFAGATKLDAVRRYASELARLYDLGNGHDVAAESRRLVDTAHAAIQQLQPFLIRHGVDDLSVTEQAHFGAIAAARWDIATSPASSADLRLLLRMDRILQLAPERKGERRNDPRFHVGWQHVSTELARAKERAADRTLERHIREAEEALDARRAEPHPKNVAVSEAIWPLIEDGEKVLVFCHHRATASELLRTLEQSLRVNNVSRGGPPETVWRAAWRSVLTNVLAEGDGLLSAPILDWLCSPGIRWQVGGWLGKPAGGAKELARQLERHRPRKAEVGATIAEATEALVKALLDAQSKSTRAVLENMANGRRAFGGEASHFPGRLDEGLRVMGSWDHERHADGPRTLYSGKPDIVLALFNSPFGPDVLIATDRLSEGVDLHRYCRHLIHYELDPSPVRTLQRNGRIRRAGSWAALTKRPIRYAYPTFGGTRDEKAVGIMRQRINAFGLLLGGVPPLDADTADSQESFAEAVLRSARDELESLNRKLRV